MDYMRFHHEMVDIAASLGAVMASVRAFVANQLLVAVSKEHCKVSFALSLMTRLAQMEVKIAVSSPCSSRNETTSGSPKRAVGILVDPRISHKRVSALLNVL